MFNSLSKLDKRIIIICILCIGAVSYLLSHPELMSNDLNTEKDSIGKVVQVKSDIRHKSKQDYFWKKTYLNNFVSKNDTIYTGSKSSAEIHLNDGKVLKISENSLIRFTSVNKNINIDLAFGKVDATGVDKTFTITDCGKQYTVDAKEASFELVKTKECGSFDLKVSKGTVAVNKKVITKSTPKKIVPKTILMEAHEEKKVALAKPVEVIKPVELPPPVVEEKVVLENPVITTASKKSIFKKGFIYNLNWNAVPKADYYNLEVADNKEFENARQNKTIDNRFEFRPIKGGNYYFKVKAYTMKGIESNPSEPVQLSLTYPAIELNNKLIQAEYKARSSKDLGKQKNFDVSWSSIDAADKYLIEVDQDPNFTKPTKLISRSPSSALPVPQTGNYHYRVSAYDSSGRKISSSLSPGEINYKKIFNMAQPIIENTLKNMSYYFQKDFAQFIWLKWKSIEVDDRKTYRIEISKSPTFNVLTTAYKTVDSKFLIKNKLEGGEYFWRVRSENDAQFSDWSDLGRFKITTQK